MNSHALFVFTKSPSQTDGDFHNNFENEYVLTNDNQK